MYQSDMSLIRSSNIKCDTVIINQCDEQKTVCESIGKSNVKMICTTERGLSKSRNLAIINSDADICILCDDDEVFEDGFEQNLVKAYKTIKDADIIAVKMKNMPAHFPDRVKKLGTLDLFHISSWQISFRRESLIKSGVLFDELLAQVPVTVQKRSLNFLLTVKRPVLKFTMSL